MRRYLLILVLICVFALWLWAATEGPNSPTVQQNDTWTNSVNMETQNDTSADGDFGDDVDQITFGFSAVTGTVDGVTFEVDGFKDSTRNNSIRADLLNVGTCTPQETGILGGSDTDTYLTLGGASDTWACTALTDTNVTNANFGVMVHADKAGGPNPVAGTYHVDHVRLTVDYTPAAAGGGKRRIIRIGKLGPEFKRCAVTLEVGENQPARGTACWWEPVA